MLNEPPTQTTGTLPYQDRSNHLNPRRPWGPDEVRTSIRCRPRGDHRAGSALSFAELLTGFSRHICPLGSWCNPEAQRSCKPPVGIRLPQSPLMRNYTGAWRSGQRSGLRTRPQWNPGSNPGAPTARMAEQQTRSAQDRCLGLPLVQVQLRASCPGDRAAMCSPAKRDDRGANPRLGTQASVADWETRCVEIAGLRAWEGSIPSAGIRVRGVAETRALGMCENAGSIPAGSIRRCGAARTTAASLQEDASEVRILPPPSAAVDRTARQRTANPLGPRPVQVRLLPAACRGARAASGQLGKLEQGDRPPRFDSWSRRMSA